MMCFPSWEKLILCWTSLFIRELVFPNIILYILINLEYLKSIKIGIAVTLIMLVDVSRFKFLEKQKRSQKRNHDIISTINLVLGLTLLRSWLLS